MKICKQCGLSFESCKSDKIFCSRLCKETNRKKRKILLKRNEKKFYCLNCFNSFIPNYGNQKFCSLECTGRVKKNNTINNCNECKSVISDKRRTVYCSDRCHYLNKAKRKNPNYKPKVRLPAIRFCKHCGQGFKPKQNATLYCSNACVIRENTGKQKSYVVKELRKQKDFEKFLTNLTKKANEFKYVSGYENSESVVTLQCKQCLNSLSRNAQFVRRDKKIICEHCKQQDIEQTNQLKKKQRELRKLISVLKKRITSLKRVQRQQLILSCKNCGVGFSRDKLNRRTFCSYTCSKRFANKTKQLLRQEKLYKNGKVDYSISLEKLIKKHNGMCVLCNEKVVLTKDYQHSLYPSIDHIIPISKGGTHTWDNVQLAHRGCNGLKSNDSILKIEKGLIVFDL